MEAWKWDKMEKEEIEKAWKGIDSLTLGSTCSLLLLES